MFPWRNRWIHWLACLCCLSIEKVEFSDAYWSSFIWRRGSYLLAIKRERTPTTSSSTWQVKAVGKIQTCYMQKHVIPRQATIAQHRTDLIFSKKHKKSLSSQDWQQLNLIPTLPSDRFANSTEAIPTPSMDNISEDQINTLLQFEAYNLSYVQELDRLFVKLPARNAVLEDVEGVEGSNSIIDRARLSQMIEENHPLLSIGKIIIFDEYKDCLRELEHFDYLWLITYMHVNSGYKKLIRPRVNPQLQEDDEHKLRKSKVPQFVGLFSSRAPHRPNPIALSALSILHVNHIEGVIYVQGSDLLDDTPILDVKPYIPAFDSFANAAAGWMDLISPNQTEARLLGYQQIHSARGARATRAGIRKKLLASSLLPAIHNSTIDQDSVSSVESPRSLRN